MRLPLRDALRTFVSLVALVLCVWTFADDVPEGETDLRDLVVSKAWELAGKKLPSGAEDKALRQAESAVTEAAKFLARNADKTSKQDLRKQAIYRSAHCYLARYARGLTQASEILAAHRCTLTVKFPSKDGGKNKEEVSKESQVIELQAQMVREKGDLLFVPDKAGRLQPLYIEPGAKTKEKIKSLVEVNLFHPVSVDGKCEAEDQVDQKLTTLGVKETVFPLQEKDEKGDPIPAVNFAAQCSSPSPSGQTLITFGPANRYELTCE